MDDPGWGHYDACPVAHGDDDTECCCDELTDEYEDTDDVARLVAGAELTTQLAADFRKGLVHCMDLAFFYGQPAAERYNKLVRSGLDPDAAYEQVLRSSAVGGPPC